MKKWVVAASLIAVAGFALAEPSRNVLKDPWMPEAVFKKMVEGQGCAIKTFKVNKGQCYEVYGKKDGKNAEHGFNPETGARVEK